MIKNKSTIKNIVYVIIIGLLIIPKTRQQIQIGLQTVIAKLSPSIEKADEAKLVSGYNWKLIDLEGNTYNFNEAKGKVILVNFWATWCPPCIAEMPSIQELYTDYSDKIEFVLVSNETQEVINSFLKKKNYNFKTYRPLTAPPTTFNVKSIPRTFLLNKEGQIIIDESGAANWNSEKVRATIDELLK
ncbi:TlpA family protein disulfide reductase [Polaribacter sp. Z014]|uniref:TlpA family protein disulfide reductase n=1 Tax=unclassified Polaribacter TaxID=196858 RepID=UPI00193B2998|nr:MULTISPECIES: TlpA disulfide reductase family protein [unclassified Polaribacter]MCL7763883.1 TlpA family protein disulfide reductase [Polaribacter sp. Z014]QVY66464.1 TlpA family protein disulfide reductase [Polaribacter sp. Q13]